MIDTAITAETNLHDALRQHPHTSLVFSAAGIDVCAGSRSIRAAAEEDGVDLDKLLDLIGLATARCACTL